MSKVNRARPKVRSPRILRLLIDPHVCPLLAEPKGTRDLMVSPRTGGLRLRQSHVDSGLDVECLCQLVFGGGSFRTGTLLQRRTPVIIQAQRPVMLNGIEDYARRGDLRDRGFFTPSADPPANRRAGNEFWRSFGGLSPHPGGRPRLIAGGLRALPSVHCPDLPAWPLRQVGRSAGHGRRLATRKIPGGIQQQPQECNVNGIGSSVIGAALLIAGSQVRRWVGTPAKLHEALTEIVGKKVAATARSKSPRLFANELRRLIPQLRLHGLSIDFERGNTGRRIVMTNTNYSQNA